MHRYIMVSAPIFLTIFSIVVLRLDIIFSKQVDCFALSEIHVFTKLNPDWYFVKI